MKGLMIRSYDTKIGVAEPTCAQFEEWQQANKTINLVRKDNAKNDKLAVLKQHGSLTLSFHVCPRMHLNKIISQIRVSLQLMQGQW